MKRNMMENTDFKIIRNFLSRYKNEETQLLSTTTYTCVCMCLCMSIYHVTWIIVTIVTESMRVGYM